MRLALIARGFSLIARTDRKGFTVSIQESHNAFKESYLFEVTTMKHDCDA